MIMPTAEEQRLTILAYHTKQHEARCQVSTYYSPSSLFKRSVIPVLRSNGSFSAVSSDRPNTVKETVQLRFPLN